MAGATWRVVVNPAEDLPEQKSITLLILPPSLAWDENGGAKATIQERVRSISTRCGGKDRLYRNTLLFMVGTKRGLTRLRQSHREQRSFGKRARGLLGSAGRRAAGGTLRSVSMMARRAALEALGPRVYGCPCECVDRRWNHVPSRMHGGSFTNISPTCGRLWWRKRSGFFGGSAR